LEEIAEEGKEEFIHAGGESFTMIPCLNTHPDWVSTLKGYVDDVKSGSTKMILS
jgi:ferrochelatase